MATKIDYELLNRMVKELKPDDNLFEALFTITAAVITEDSDLAGADEALHIVMQAITEKFFKDGRNERERQWTTKTKRKTFTYVG